jgi:hypothetical protein
MPAPCLLGWSLNMQPRVQSTHPLPRYIPNASCSLIPIHKLASLAYVTSGSHGCGTNPLLVPCTCRLTSMLLRAKRAYGGD